MRKTFICAMLTVLAGAVFAQTPAEKAKPAPAKPAVAAPVAPAQAAPKPAAAAPAPVKKPEPAKPAAKAAEDQEESMVMIDDKADADYSRAAPAEQAADTPLPKGLPSSFGQCKGAISDGGRNILVFENPDDGQINFVQITFGKGGVSWRLVDALPRYGAESVASGSDADYN